MQTLQNNSSVDSFTKSKNMPTLNQRKNLRNRRGSNLGTVQLMLQLLEHDGIKSECGNNAASTYSTMPINLDIRRACRRSCAIDEVRVRLHEIVSCSKWRRRQIVVRTESTKLSKANIKTRQGKKSKSGIINLPQLLLTIPGKVCADGQVTRSRGVHVQHILEIKLISRGIGVQNLSFKFPYMVGSGNLQQAEQQQYKIMTDNHLCHHHPANMMYAKASKSGLRMLLKSTSSSTRSCTSSTVATLSFED